MASAELNAYRGGANVAMKIPPDAYEATMRFYRDTLGLPVEARGEGTVVVDFGPIRLWLDRVERLSQAEIWLEVISDEARAAAAELAGADVVRCDAIEPLPEDFRGFWIKNPAGIVHLVAEPGQDG